MLPTLFSVRPEPAVPKLPRFVRGFEAQRLPFFQEASLQHVWSTPAAPAMPKDVLCHQRLEGLNKGTPSLQMIATRCPFTSTAGPHRLER